MNTEKKTGIELIAEERTDQLIKYGYTGEHHVNNPQWYEERQLIYAALILSLHEHWGNIDNVIQDCPVNWNKERWEKMVKKPYKERLAIAGSFMAAELDRIQEKENVQDPTEEIKDEV